MIFIGIDPGKKTGYAAYNSRAKELTTVVSCPIFIAMEKVRVWERIAKGKFFVIVEDARKRPPDKEWGLERLQGAGSIKRDSAIWEEFLTYYDIPHQMKAPRNTNIKAKPFQMLTGYTERIDQHARDAAMIVYGMQEKSWKALRQFIR